MNWEKSHDHHEQQWTIRDDTGLVASIFFVNGQFDRVWFSFKRNYTREQWKTLAAIEKQISKIERGLRR